MLEGQNVRYCPICGRDADPAIHRLGEAFCSEAHAEEFTREVNALVSASRDRDAR